jgi:OmpA-OmpF porin, OOP family
MTCWNVAPMSLLAFAVVAGAAGCTLLPAASGAGAGAPAHCAAATDMELVIGAHRDTPKPVLGPFVVCQLTATIRASDPVHIVVAAGQPGLVPLRLGSISGGTLAQQGSPRLQEDVRLVSSAVATARPGSPGVDDLAALAVAVDQARSDGRRHPELILIDSGLDDRGPLNFTVPGMLAATPAEVARQIKKSGDLPELRGCTVVLVGIGYTASPQTPLSARWRSNVTQIWAAVLRSAGATVLIVPQPAQGPSIKTGEPVKLVPVPTTRPVDPGTRGTIIFSGESPIRFEPNTTAFVDAAAAVKALRPIARWLAADDTRHAFLEGTTADVGPMAGQVELSGARADRVKAELVALGATAAQISTKGVGSDFPQFVLDRNAAGILLAGPATLNRSVRITLRRQT